MGILEVPPMKVELIPEDTFANVFPPAAQLFILVVSWITRRDYEYVVGQNIYTHQAQRPCSHAPGPLNIMGSYDTVIIAIT